jgi:ribosomal-protein-alanine N-acetyltransferase
MTADIRLISVDDTAELTALVTQNLDFLAPWDPLRSADYTSEPTQRQLIIDALERHAAGTSIPLVITEAGSVVGRINVTDIVRGVFESAHLGEWQDHLLFQRTSDQRVSSG